MNGFCNSLANCDADFVCDLERIQASRHDLLVLDLTFRRQEVLERRTDHDPVARERRGQEDTLLGHSVRVGEI